MTQTKSARTSRSGIFGIVFVVFVWCIILSWHIKLTRLATCDRTLLARKKTLAKWRVFVLLTLAIYQYILLQVDDVRYSRETNVPYTSSFSNIISSHNLNVAKVFGHIKYKLWIAYFISKWISRGLHVLANSFMNWFENLWFLILKIGL